MELTRIAGTLIQPARRPRIAIVHDWLVVYGGAERCLRQLIALFPDAEVFAIVDFFSDEDRAALFGKRATTSFIQKLPFAKTKYRNYLPLMPLAIEQFDLSGFDLVISSSHAVAKGVLTGPGQKHICYCYTPIRYAWDFQHQYLRESRMTRGLKSAVARLALHYIRMWDSRTAHGVDRFVAISGYIAGRIRKTYGRDAEVLYPPVDLEAFPVRRDKSDFYLAASRLVPYKRVDLIVEAFAAMPGKRLVVIGDGPEMARIRKLAPANVTLLGFQADAVLLDHLQRARAFVFAAEEDFGLLPVEAQACGTPVIAFGKGGVGETVIGLDNPAGHAPTGVFFDAQTVASIMKAVALFETVDISADVCRSRAGHFSVVAFQTAWLGIINASESAATTTPGDINV